MQQQNRCPDCGSPLKYGQSLCQLCGTQQQGGKAQQPGWDAPKTSGGTKQPGWVRQQLGRWQQPGWGAPSTGSQPLSTITLLLIVFLVLIIGLCSFIFLQFGVKPDKSLPPIISEVSVDFRGKTSARIIWQTDKPCSSQVEYGRTTQYGSLAPSTPQNDPSTGKSGGVTDHIVNLSNLKAGATYNYRVRSRDSAGNEAISENKSFKTSAEATFVSPD